jgi:hypothetical protein
MQLGNDVQALRLETRWTGARAYEARLSDRCSSMGRRVPGARSGRDGRAREGWTGKRSARPAGTGAKTGRLFGKPLSVRLVQRHGTVQGARSIKVERGEVRGSTRGTKPASAWRLAQAVQQPVECDAVRGRGRDGRKFPGPRGSSQSVHEWHGDEGTMVPGRLACAEQTYGSRGSAGRLLFWAQTHHPILAQFGPRPRRHRRRRKQRARQRWEPARQNWRTCDRRLQ